MFSIISGLNFFNPANAQPTDIIHIRGLTDIWDSWQRNSSGGAGERRDQAVTILKEFVLKGDAILNLSGLNLAEIPVLPPGIAELNVSDNALTDLPEIPLGVKKIDASHNRLAQLPTMPSTLEELNLANNEFIELPYIGHPLRKLDFSDNPLIFKIPKIIHYVWLGTSPLPAFAVSNIINSAAINPDYEVKVWVENTAKMKSQLVNAGYSKAIFSKVKFIEPNPPFIIQAIIGREGDKTQFANYAAASDILRLYIMSSEGGLYLDVDVAMEKPLGEIKSQSHERAPMSDFLWQITCKYVDNRNVITYGNAVLASVENSFSAGELLYEAISPYKATNDSTSLGSLNSIALIMNFSKEILNVGVNVPKTNRHSRGFTPEMLNKSLEYNDVMWDLKKTNSLYRINLTTLLTGPHLIGRYFESKGIKIELSHHIRADKSDFYSLNKSLSSITLSNSEIFGQSDQNNPKYVWVKDVDAEGRWVYLDKFKKEFSEV